MIDGLFLAAETAEHHAAISDWQARRFEARGQTHEAALERHAAASLRALARALRARADTEDTGTRGRVST